MKEQTTISFLIICYKLDCVLRIMQYKVHTI